MDCSLSGSSVHRIFQARELEWIAISFSRGSSRPRNRTWVSRIAGRRFTVGATREALAPLLYRICFLSWLTRVINKSWWRMKPLNFINKDLKSCSVPSNRSANLSVSFSSWRHQFWCPPSSNSGVPNLWDLRPDYLKWSWCNNNRNKVHNKCNVLESPQKHSFPQSLGKFSSWNWSLVPKRSGTAVSSSSWYT